MPNERTSLTAGIVGIGGYTVEKAASVENASSDNTTQLQQPSPIYQRIWTICCNIYDTHSFLIKALVLILLAFAYPPLGAIYFVPEITATWIAVIFIFVLAGMGIKTEEFAKAFQRLPFNVFVQVFNFGAVSSIVYGFSRFMVSVNALSQSLADGMTICASLPITINMVLVLTKSAEGDEAAAIFNAAIGNLVGVFLSPALILMYLGVSGQIDMGDVFFKLGVRVVLPVFVGQVLQHFVTPAKEFVKRYKHYFKVTQEWCLLFIIYTVFCKTFMEGMEADVGQIFLMIALQFFLLCVVMMLAWICLRVLFRNEPRLQAMGLFGCTNKTMASGIPLINAIYGSNPMVGLYTLPLLIWHPMQLVVGSFVAPYVAAYVKRREDESEFQEEEEKVTMALPALV
jgi:sodium/bile acid cotransporter 7